MIKDIEGCFPNMPKPAIVLALTHILQELRISKGYSAVYVPTADSKPCRWDTRATGYKKIPFEILIDVIKFALDNTIITNGNGDLFNPLPDLVRLLIPKWRTLSNGYLRVYQAAESACLVN